MNEHTSIEWTDATWNPVAGCRWVSPGCQNCYAEAIARRFSAPGQPYHGLITDGRWNGTFRSVPAALSLPLRWRKPRRVFVNSMSDLFGECVTNEWIAAVFGVMALSPQHTFQVLTKRADRMMEWFRWLEDRAERASGFHDATVLDAAADAGVAVPRASGAPWPLPNVWLGVSVEDQQRAEERIPPLLEMPAAVRWVSYEPALGPADFTPWLTRDYMKSSDGEPLCVKRGKIDWIVIGGESGPGARAFNLARARVVITQCRTAETPVFVKQLGARPFNGYVHGERSLGTQAAPRWLRLLDRKGGDPAEWPEALRVREYPDREELG